MQEKLTDATFMRSAEVTVSQGAMKGPKFLTNGKGETLKDVLIDTYANRTSAMGMPQYREYCDIINVTEAISPVTHISVRGIGGS